MSTINEKLSSLHIQVANKTILQRTDSKNDLDILIDLVLNGQWTQSTLTKLDSYNQEIKRDIIQRILNRITSNPVIGLHSVIRVLGHLWMNLHDKCPWFHILHLHADAWPYVLYELNSLFSQCSKEDVNRLLEFFQSVISDLQFPQQLEFYKYSVVSTLLHLIESRTVYHYVLDSAMPVLLNACTELKTRQSTSETVYECIQRLFMHYKENDIQSITLYRRIVMASIRLLLAQDSRLSMNLLDFIHHLMSLMYDASSIRVIVTSICYLLVVDEHRDTIIMTNLIKLLEKAISKLCIHDGQGLLIQFAFYPLYKIKLDGVYTTLSNTVSQIIHEFQEKSVDQMTFEIDLTDIKELPEFTGLIACITCILEYLPRIHANWFEFSQLNLPLNTHIRHLFIASLLYHNNVQMRRAIYSYFSQCMPPTITNLSYLMELLCAKDGKRQESQEIQWQMLIQVLTSYAKTKNSFIISCIFQMVDELSCNGIVKCSIYHYLWTVYPRCWNKLRSLMGQLVQKYKTSIIKDVQLETFICNLLYLTSKYESVDVEDLLGLVFKCLDLESFSIPSKALVLKSLFNCIEKVQIHPVSLWSTVLLPFHSLDLMDPLITIEMCTFYGIVGSFTSESDSFIEFRQFILANHVKLCLNSRNVDLQKHANQALLHFPMESILLIHPIPSKSISTIDSDLLSSVLKREIQSIGRSLFKGISLSSFGNKHEKQGKEITSHIHHSWQHGRISMSKKMGYSLVSIHLVPCAETKSSLLTDLLFQMGIKDVLYDSEWQMMDAITFWTCVWNQQLLRRYKLLSKSMDSHYQILNTLSMDLNCTTRDIYERLKSSISPNQTMNLVFCLAGLLISGIEFGIFCSYDLLLECVKLQLKSNSEDGFSKVFVQDFYSSDLVWKSILLSLGFLGKYIQKNELEWTLNILEFIIQKVDQDNLCSLFSYLFLLDHMEPLYAKEYIERVKPNLFLLNDYLFSMFTNLPIQRSDDTRQTNNTHFEALAIQSSLTKDSLEFGNNLLLEITKGNQVDFILALIPYFKLQFGFYKPIGHEQNVSEAMDTLFQLLQTHSDPKFLRVCGWVLSKLLFSIDSTLHEFQTSIHSKEPMDYTRFPQDSSWLRIVFETLSSPQVSIQVCNNLLKTLVKLQEPLPSCNWRRTLMNIQTKFPESAYLLFHFAFKQSVLSQSSSLTGYFIENVMKFIRTRDELAQGCKILLELSGFHPRNQIPLISMTQFSTLFDQMVQTSFSSSESCVEYPLELVKHLPDKNLKHQQPLILVISNTLTRVFIEYIKNISIPDPNQIQVTLGLVQHVNCPHVLENMNLSNPNPLEFWTLLFLQDGSLQKILPILQSIYERIPYYEMNSYSSAFYTWLKLQPKTIIQDSLVKMLDLCILLSQHLVKVMDYGLLCCLDVFLNNNNNEKPSIKVYEWSLDQISILKYDLLYEWNVYLESATDSDHLNRRWSSIPHHLIH